MTSLGSGVIVSKEGHIVTNNHVLNGTDDVTVQLSDGRQAKAKIVGSDGQIDLAVLKIDLENLTPLTLHSVTTSFVLVGYCSTISLLFLYLEFLYSFLVNYSIY